MRVLDVGAGTKPVPGAVTIDISPMAKPDVVHDLDVFPWPFKDDEFDAIHARHVLEHLDDLVATMEEIHRIGRNGARVHIVVPHYSSVNAYRDPTHRRFLGRRSFDYFTGEHEHDHYTSVRYKTIRRDITFNDWPFAWLARFVAKRWPDYYEERLAWLHPALEVHVELEVVK